MIDYFGYVTDEITNITVGIHIPHHSSLWYYHATSNRMTDGQMSRFCQTTITRGLFCKGVFPPMNFIQLKSSSDEYLSMFIVNHDKTSYVLNFSWGKVTWMFDKVTYDINPRSPWHGYTDIALHEGYMIHWCHQHHEFLDQYGILPP